MEWRNVKDMTREEIIDWLRGPKGKTMSQDAAERLADQMKNPQKPESPTDEQA